MEKQKNTEKNVKCFLFISNSLWGWEQPEVLLSRSNLLESPQGEASGSTSLVTSAISLASPAARQERKKGSSQNHSVRLSAESLHLHWNKLETNRDPECKASRSMKREDSFKVTSFLRKTFKSHSQHWQPNSLLSDQNHLTNKSTALSRGLPIKLEITNSS